MGLNSYCLEQKQLARGAESSVIAQDSAHAIESKPLMQLDT